MKSSKISKNAAGSRKLKKKMKNRQKQKKIWQKLFFLEHNFLRK